LSLLPLPLLPLSLLQLPLSARQPSAQLTGVSVIQAQSSQLELADNSDDWDGWAHAAEAISPTRWYTTSRRAPSTTGPALAASRRIEAFHGDRLLSGRREDRRDHRRLRRPVGLVDLLSVTARRSER
jgi:hypothetical protein